MRPVSYRRPLWYYGILCLIFAVIPNVVSGPPADAEARAVRFVMMVALSLVGFGLIGWSAVKSWRASKKP